MKFTYFAVLCLSVFILTLTACAGKSGSEENMIVEEIVEDLEAQLNIALYKTAFHDFSVPIQEFKKVNPDIPVNVTEYRFWQDDERYLTQLSTALMSGTSDDILVLHGDLYRRFGGSPYLMDMNGFIGSDPEMEREDYYENVLEAFEIEGKLIGFPLRFNMLYAGIKAGFTEKLPDYQAYDAVTYRQLLDLYVSLAEGDRAGYYFEYNNDIFRATKMSSFFSYTKGIANFDNPQYIQLIKDAKYATNPQKDFLAMPYFMPHITGSTGTDYVFCLAIDKEKSMFLPGDGGYNYEKNGHMFGPDDDYLDLKPLLSDEGEGLIYTDGAVFAISENSKNKELAFALLKFLTMEEAYPLDRLYGGPNYIVREVNEEFTAHLLGQHIGVCNEDGTLTAQQSSHVAQTMALLNHNLQRPIRNYTDGYIPGANEILMQFYANTITAEDAAAQLQNAVSLYMME